MDANFVVLIVAIVIFLTGLSFMGVKLEKSNRLNVILSERNLLYKEFMTNTSLKKYLKIIESVRAESLDFDISVMLQKYFRMAFINLKAKNLAMLINEIESNKHSDFIMSAFVKANIIDNFFLLGDALFEATRDCNMEQEEILNNFLEKFPLDSQKNQLMFVVECLNKYLDRELGDHVVSEIRTAMEAVRTRIQKRIEFIK